MTESMSPPGEDATELPFVELEFTHALGPPAGAYVIEAAVPDGSAPLTGERPRDEAEVLLLRLVAAPRGTSRRRRRLRSVSPGEPAASVPVMSVIHVRRCGGHSARELVAQCAESTELQREWVAATLGWLNRAIRAHRAQAGDPYFPEVAASDPRRVRIGYGFSADLVRAQWTVAWEVAAPAVRRRGRDGEISRSSEAVAAALAGVMVTSDADELLLRGLCDLEQARPTAAVMQLHAAAELLLAEADRDSSGADGFRGRAQEIDDVRAAHHVLVGLRGQALSAGAGTDLDAPPLWNAARALTRALEARRQARLERHFRRSSE